MPKREGISRRRLVGRAVLGVIAVGAATKRAVAQQKVSKSEAKYENEPRGQQRCEICVNFQPPSSCRFVDGQINPKGWCEFFAAKENAH